MATLLELRETDGHPIAIYEPEDRAVPSWTHCRGWRDVDLRLRSEYHRKTLQFFDAPPPRKIDPDLHILTEARVTLSRGWDPRKLDRKAWAITVEAYERVENPAAPDAVVQVTYRDVRIAYGDALAQARKIVQGHRNALERRRKAAEEARKAALVASQGDLFAGLEDAR